jgi:hypothetical protein
MMLALTGDLEKLGLKYNLEGTAGGVWPAFLGLGRRQIVWT